MHLEGNYYTHWKGYLMLEKLLKLYVMYMATDTRSPLPHLFGPPGCGKSTFAEQLADLVEKKLHIINVSRLNVFELEGVQMPVSSVDAEELKLKLLHATFWTQLQEGDIVLLDEFLRAFPEIYNGLLDILTSRQVGGMVLPKVFIMAASNSVVAYDKALEDRLLHLPVPDLRRSKAARAQVARLIVDQLGLWDQSAICSEMDELITTEILPMYDLLDQLDGKGGTGAITKGSSVRKLIGQAQLREVRSSALRELITINNQRACTAGKAQYVLLMDGKSRPSNYDALAAKLNTPAVKKKLTPIQARNLELNLQLIELESMRHEKGTDEDDIFDTPDSEFI